MGQVFIELDREEELTGEPHLCVGHRYGRLMTNDLPTSKGFDQGLVCTA